MTPLESAPGTLARNLRLYLAVTGGNIDETLRERARASTDSFQA